MEYARLYLGLLVPSADLVVEQDFRNTLPLHVGTHVARMYQDREPVSNLENLQRILDAAETAAGARFHAKPEMIIFCGTSASFMHGKGSGRGTFRPHLRRFRRATIDQHDQRFGRGPRGPRRTAPVLLLALSASRPPARRPVSSGTTG